MPIDLPSYIAGEAVHTDRKLSVTYPWDGTTTGTLSLINSGHLNKAIDAAIDGQRSPLDRHARHAILRNAATLIAKHRTELAHLICRETGLCIRETMYETGRSSDVLEFAAAEALKDNGQVFSCDISPQGKARKIITFGQPVQLVSAITPFNHPLNQVAHKVAPAIAAGAPMLLKPSEKTPLTAIRFCELLYEAGLPGWMLSMFVGDIDEVDPSILLKQLDNDLIPIISPLSADESGTLLNINADTVAAAVAVALNAEKLILATGAPGILECIDDPRSVISYLDVAGLNKLRSEGRLSNGMLPKAAAIKSALAGGVSRVHVISYDLPDSLLLEVFTNEGMGTLVVNDIENLTPDEQQE